MEISVHSSGVDSQHKLRLRVYVCIISNEADVKQTCTVDWSGAIHRMSFQSVSLMSCLFIRLFVCGEENFNLRAPALEKDDWQRTLLKREPHLGHYKI